MAVAEQAQIRQRILDFHPLEEALPAIDTVGNPRLQKRLFQHPRLGVGAIQHGHFPPRGAFLKQLVHAPGNKARFVHFVETGIETNRVAITALGPQLLAQAIAVIADHRVGGFQDGAGGAVVLLQANGAGIREVAAEFVDVLDLGAAPAIDGLVVVTDDSDRIVLVRQQPQPGVLNTVGILEFVHQNVPEAALIVATQILVVAEQLQHPQQHFVEVHQPATLAGVFVGEVDLLHGQREQIAAHIHMPGAQALIFLAVNEPGGLTGRPALLIQPQFLAHPLDQSNLVVRIDDLEALGKPGLLPVGPQQPVGNAVEGAHPHAVGGHIQQLLNTPAHFRGGLVGKGHRQNAKRRGLFGGDLPGDPVHQHSGFSRASPGQHQQMSVIGSHRIALGRVQAINKGSHIIHGAEV